VANHAAGDRAAREQLARDIARGHPLPGPALFPSDPLDYRPRVYLPPTQRGWPPEPLTVHLSAHPPTGRSIPVRRSRRLRSDCRVRRGRNRQGRRCPGPPAPARRGVGHRAHQTLPGHRGQARPAVARRCLCGGADGPTGAVRSEVSQGRLPSASGHVFAERWNVWESLECAKQASRRPDDRKL
jgi:hypothetical protein